MIIHFSLDIKCLRQFARILYTFGFWPRMYNSLNYSIKIQYKNADRIVLRCFNLQFFSEFRINFSQMNLQMKYKYIRWITVTRKYFNVILQALKYFLIRNTIFNVDKLIDSWLWELFDDRWIEETKNWTVKLNMCSKG